MKNNFDIIWYLIPLAIGLLKFLFKDKQKSPQKVMPLPKEVVLPKREVVILNPDTTPTFGKTATASKAEKVHKKAKLERKQTFLGENPYEESIEYRKRKVKRRREQKEIKEEFSNTGSLEIDWKQAIIFSEILKPRF